MGPEIGAGWFRPIARKPSFKRRVTVVLVDKLHLVDLWRIGIRPQQAQLSLLRRRLGALVQLLCHHGSDDIEIARKMTGF